MYKLRTGIRFIKAKLTGQRVPLFVGWDLTGRCNFDCCYCRVSQQSYAEKELSTSDVLAGISQLADLGTMRIHFGGGEVLLREDVGVILESCRDKGIYTAVLTNGLLVPERLAVLKRADLVKISFDGPRDVHDKLRRNGSYDSVINALELCKKENINLALNVALSQCNMEHIEFILDFSRRCRVPVKFQLINEFLSGDKDVSGLVLNPKQQKNVLRKILLEKRTHKYIINSYAALKYMRDYPNIKVRLCCAGRIYLRIAENGGLYPCLMMKNHVMTSSFIERGMKAMLQELPELKCGHCLCTSTLEVDFIYNLSLEALINNLRKF